MHKKVNKMEEDLCDQCGEFGEVIRIKPYKNLPDNAPVRGNLDDIRELTRDFCFGCYAGQNGDQEDPIMTNYGVAA